MDDIWLHTLERDGWKSIQAFYLSLKQIENYLKIGVCRQRGCCVDKILACLNSQNSRKSRHGSTTSVIAALLQGNCVTERRTSSEPTCYSFSCFHLRLYCSLNVKCPPWLLCRRNFLRFRCCIPSGGTVWEVVRPLGVSALLERGCHWGWTFRCYSLATFLILLLLPDFKNNFRFLLLCLPTRKDSIPL